MALDVKRMSRNDQIVAGAGVLVLLLSFFDWYEVSGGGFSQGAGAWDMHLFGAKGGVLLSLLAAIWVLVVAAGTDVRAIPVPPRLVALVLSALAVLLLIIQRTRVENVEFGGFEAGWTILYYLTLVVAIAQTVFAFLAFQQDGGMNAARGGTGGTGGLGTTGTNGDYPPPPPTV